MSDYHFGGGIFQKVEGGAQGRNREEIMKEVVAKSKFYKQMHQKEREESIALTQELDDELSVLLPHLSGMWKDGNLKEAGDEFDMLTRELAFEVRAKPLNRLPTDEEIAQKHRDRLALLEKMRERRMLGLSDDEEPEEEPEDEEMEEEEEDDSSDEEEEGKDEPETPKEEPRSRRNYKGKGKKAERKKEPPKPLTEKELQLIENSLREDAIPFLIAVPQSLADLQRLFHGRSPAQLRTIVARIVASNNANLGPSFKQELQRMFELTIHYFEWVVDKPVLPDQADNGGTEVLDILAQALFTLLPPIAITGVQFIKEKLIGMHQALDEALIDTEDTERKAKSDLVWKTSELYFFKVVVGLFPVSDFQHPVVTPALLLMNRFITYLPVRTFSGVMSKLFVCSLLHQVSLFVKENPKR